MTVVMHTAIDPPRLWPSDARHTVSIGAITPDDMAFSFAAMAEALNDLGIKEREAA